MTDTICEIEVRLNQIIQKRFNFDFMQFYTKKSDVKEVPLLGNLLNFQPRDLLYIFLDVEKEFNITLPQEEIVNGNFDTFSNIYTIIKNELAAGGANSPMQETD